ncbi:major facilitator transporter [Burkholderia sp. TJI49]|nr:major facilitator transporter [Burkholderia sp. TJI49]
MKAILNRDFLALILSVAVVGLGTGATLPLTALALTEAGHGTNVVGMLTAAQAGGGLAIVPFVTALARRIGARRAIVVSVVLLAAATALMQFTSSLIVWAVLRVLCGAALMLLFTIGEAWVNQLADDSTRGRVVAIYATNFTLFQMAGPVLVSQIAGATGIRFALCGALFLLALPTLATIRRAPLAGDDAHHETHDHWLAVLPRMPALIIGTGFFALFDTLALSLLPLYAMDHGVASETAVLLASIMLFGDTAMQFPIGWLADKLGRERVHLLLELLHHLRLPAEQETRGVRHVDRVIGFGNRADARRGAAPDLVQQARPRAVVEDRILAGAQLEHALQDLDALAHRPRARERPEILVLLVDRAAVVRHSRKTVRGELQVRIRLVVAKQDVVARRERLDQVVLEQQRLGLRTRDGRLDARDARDHHRDARRQLRLREIARHALFQVARLAHVEHGARRVVVAVDARHVRQLREDLLRFERGVGSFWGCHA